jgi:transcription elongation factor
MMRLLLISVAALGLSACGDKAQTSAGVKSDAPAFESVTGPGNAYNAPGWKAGDKTAWEQQLKTRAQNGQNEYNRIK